MSRLRRSALTSLSALLLVLPAAGARAATSDPKVPYATSMGAIGVSSFLVEMENRRDPWPFVVFA